MNLWRRWAALLERREDPLALALCRIVAGFTVCSHLSYTWAVGVATAVWVDARHGGIRSFDAGWLERFGGATPGNIHALLALGVVGSALMTVGAFTRVAAVATWFAFNTLTRLNDRVSGSSDELLVCALFVLMFSGCGRALSLDARLRGARGDAPAWPRYVLVYQLGIMYWASGLQKVSAGWVPGGPADALWYVLQQPTWQRRSMAWLAPFYPLTQAATLATWLFENAAPLLLLAVYFRATRARPGRVRALFNRLDVRRAYLVAGLCLHLGIELCMEVGQFLGAVLALYACCVEPEEWRSLGRSLARGWRRVRGGGGATPSAG